jgi:hypothetical protein
MAFDANKYINDKADEFFSKVVLGRKAQNITAFKDDFNAYVQRLENITDRRTFKRLIIEKFDSQANEDRNQDYNYVVYSYQPA